MVEDVPKDLKDSCLHLFLQVTLLHDQRVADLCVKIEIKILCVLQMLRPTVSLPHCWSWASKKLMSSVCFWCGLLNIKKGNMSGLPGWLNSVISSSVRSDLQFCDYFSIIHLSLAFSVRFKGALHVLGVLNQSWSGCILVLSHGTQAGGCVDSVGVWGTLGSSLQLAGKLGPAGELGLGALRCSGELPPTVCRRGAKAIT